ncbi:MAG TPA: hypothetical protein VJ279_04070 [Hanamia sp.]|jgi:hypothetical protein|nr:hypothetical protein [Hanamia sp.]
MSEIDLIKLDGLLLCWGLWTYSFEKNQQGWPEESTLYKFLREGFVGNDSKSRGSRLPYKHSEKAEIIDALYLRLKKESYKKAEALYVFYVTQLNVKEFCRVAKIVPSTFYKRLAAAKIWINGELDKAP